MRPKDTLTRKKRVSQIQKCRELKSAQQSRQSTAEVLPQKASASLPHAVENTVDYSDKIPLEPTAEAIHPVEEVGEDQSYLNEFDKFINVDGNGGFDTSLPGEGASLAPTVAGTLYELEARPAPVHKENFFDRYFHHLALPDFFKRGSVDELCIEKRPVPDLDTPLSSLSMTSIGIAPVEETEPGSILLSTSNLGDGVDPAWGLQGTEHSNDTASVTVSSTNQLFDRGRKAVAANVDGEHQDLFASSNHEITSSTTDSRKIRLSGLSASIDPSSKYSLGEKSFIKDLLEHCSVSRLSSMRSSIFSRSSALSRQGSGSSGLHMHTGPVQRALPKNQTRLLDLPGDFITPNVNIFPRHIHCQVERSAQSSPTPCEHCFTDGNFSLAQTMWRIPWAVTEFKRGNIVSEIWSTDGNPWWMDRFGNTTLHLAAALGAPYAQIRDLICKSGINARNSANQTFACSEHPAHGIERDILPKKRPRRERI